MWYGATYRMSQNKKSTPYLNVFLEKNQPFFWDTEASTMLLLQDIGQIDIEL